MNELTKIQRFTLILVIGGILWEISVRIWMSQLAKSDPVIRVDLLITLPLIALFLGISIYQYLKKE